MLYVQCNGKIKKYYENKYKQIQTLIVSSYEHSMVSVFHDFGQAIHFVQAATP